MKKRDVLVVGGSAGGLLSATTAKKVYADKSVLVVRRTETAMVPCGIPYIYGTLGDTAKNRIPDEMIIAAGVEMEIDEVKKIDPDAKIATLGSGVEIGFEKLVIATGSLPLIPKDLPGHDLENVIAITKEEEVLAAIRERLQPCKKVVVIGGGFIGVEFAEQMQMAGKEVALVEIAPYCLWQAFDDEYCRDAEKAMRKKGIEVLTDTAVVSIKGDKKVNAVELNDGRLLEADAVILALGVKPNSALAAEAGLELNGDGAIKVDDYMRTSHPDIFAVGDCAEKRCFFTHKNVPVLLASTAAMEAKVAAGNLFGLRFVRQNKGTISAFITHLYGKTYAAAGITERRALEEGFAIKVGKAATTDKHPGSLPGTSALRMKLIFAQTSGVLIGAQISGGDTVGEMINILSLAIQKGLTANELNTFQVATHPLVSPSPITYPINAAALEALAGK